MALLGAVGAVLGGLAGAQGSNQSQTSSVKLAPASELEKQAGSIAGQQLGSLNQLVGAGAGQQDVEAGLTSQRGLAAMLQSFSQGNFLPSAQDNQTAQQFAASQFQPRQLAMQNAFQEQEQRAAQLASQLGRPVNDPIIQARLAQEQTRQQGSLAAEQQAFGTQFAMNLPQQRLGFTAQLADVNANLASQAMSNRQALMSLGSQLQNNERNFRLQTASRTTSQQGGGGLQGAISGALGGFGAFSSISNLFGGGQANMQGGLSPEQVAGRAGEAAYQFPQQQQSFAPQAQQFNFNTQQQPQVTPFTTPSYLQSFGPGYNQPLNVNTMRGLPGMQ